MAFKRAPCLQGLPALLAAAATAAAGGSYPLPPLSGYGVAEPVDFVLLRRSGASALYDVVLPEERDYSLGRVRVVKLVGGREEVGRAYADLVGAQAVDLWDRFMAATFKTNFAAREAVILFAEWLWSKHYSQFVPEGFLRELDGMRKGSPHMTGHLTVDQVSTRFNTLANMPADPRDIISALEFELEKGLPEWEASLLNRVINHLDHCDWCIQTPNGPRFPFSPGCDSFGVWGSRTAGGELFTSRNLDWNKDTGIAHHKLVTVMHIDGVPPYATFGHASGFGSLAGMSERGITVSEMNLDNSQASFSGPPFPLRLRMLLEGATDLASAKAIWLSTNNTDSMNFMIGSASDQKSMAIEAMRGFSTFFLDNDPVEAAATCTVGTDSASGLRDLGSCGSGWSDIKPADGKKQIGYPLQDAVWRTNHAVHPRHLASQKPMNNDTSFRYMLLHDLIEEHGRQNILVGDSEAVSIAAALGTKGTNYLSCDPAQFPHGSNILSVAYRPRVGSGSAYVAWEDGTGPQGWRPAACTTYVRFDMTRWWAGGARASGISGAAVLV